MKTITKTNLVWAFAAAMAGVATAEFFGSCNWAAVGQFAGHTVLVLICVWIVADKAK